MPKWADPKNDSRGGGGFPVVKDGVIYTTAHNMTAAVDALTGKQLWRTAHDYPPETLRVVCCGIVNCGVAIYNGMITGCFWTTRSSRSMPRPARRSGRSSRRSR